MSPRKGGSWCSAINCTNNSNTNQGYNFFRFPSDSERCKKWVINCRRRDLLHKSEQYLYRNCKLCSAHFDKSLIILQPCGRAQLLKNAIPTIFNTNKSQDIVKSMRMTPIRRRKVQLETHQSYVIPTYDCFTMPSNTTDNMTTTYIIKGGSSEPMHLSENGSTTPSEETSPSEDEEPVRCLLFDVTWSELV